jgi:hypothetical protein
MKLPKGILITNKRKEAKCRNLLTIARIRAFLPPVGVLTTYHLSLAMLVKVALV